MRVAQDDGIGIRAGPSGSVCRLGTVVLGGLAALLLGSAAVTAVQNNAPGAGLVSSAYGEHCALCHGTNLGGSQFAPALVSDEFLAKWGGKNAGELYDYIRANMPPGQPAKLPDSTYTAVVELILRRNGIPTGIAAGPLDRDQLALIVIPAGMENLNKQGIFSVSPRFPAPPWPEPRNALANYRPVTEGMLDDPAPADWLTWRRSHRGMGFSPLAQIETSNVNRLRVAWSLALPAGTNVNEPLVHDGVVFVFGFGDEVYALDGADGRVLWRYQRKLPQGVQPISKRTMALLGDRLFVAMSDLHLVALDAHTGKVAWDSLITDKPGYRIPGGPLVADGVVMQGLTTQLMSGSGLIAGFDAQTGRHLWTRNTIAQPGQPGGNSWNGLPADRRSGASVWLSGTYDRETGVALFGTGQTYDTGPLLTAKPGQSNDALYTDTTLAIEPRTGKLRWYFQHMKNDQWDLDWVFERVIGNLDVAGKKRRVIITAGKEGLFDVLDADTGRYLKTVDMGLQDFVTRIDPKTGEKIVDPQKFPDRSRPVFVCPNAGGGRNWMPTAFNPQTKSIFVVARDVCMDLVPAINGGGVMSSGVNFQYAIRPGSDGRYGLLQALDMQAGKTRWKVHQRAPFATGVLTTGAGLLFAGSVDRQFMAYDQASGAELWREGLGGVPSGSPISYSADGKQYVAVVTGHGFGMNLGLGGLTPEIMLPPVSTSEIVAFSLPK